MLKRRSRSVGGKERFTIADSNSPQSPSASDNLSKLTASSHLLFRSFSSKRFADIEAAVSPTSILETRPFSSSSSISNSDRQAKKPPFDAVEPIGLGIVDALDVEKARKNSESSMIISGSQLRVQIPSNGGSVELLNSPIEFGVKNKESQLALFSLTWKSSGHEVPAVSRSISMSEMELSEDYTRVISHGANPKTTHIFGNRIVASCSDESITARKENHGADSTDGFLTSCHACKRILGEGIDIYMYRGEKAFCSIECRHREILIDEGAFENPSPDLSSSNGGRIRML